MNRKNIKTFRQEQKRKVKTLKQTQESNDKSNSIH